MAEQDILQSVYPYIGGQENVSRTIPRKGTLYLMLKDAGVVNLAAVNQVQGVISAELERGRLTLQLEGKEQEVPGMAEKRNGAELAKEILELVGGEENVISLTHCVTRLRFELKNVKKAQTEQLKKTNGVLGVMVAGGQYQVLIGARVQEIYDEVCKITRFAEPSKQQSEENKPFYSKILPFIAAAFSPSAMMLCAAGMIKGILALITALGWMSKEAGIYVLLSGIANAPFFFLPALIGYNIAKRMKSDIFTAVTVGLALCIPSINGVDIELFGHVFNNTYTSTVLPAFFTVILAVYAERFLNKHLPDMVKGFLTPMLIFVIVVPIGYMLVGPAANLLADGVSFVINLLYNFNHILSDVVIGGFYQILVVLGVHSVIVLPALMDVMAGTPSPNYASLGVVSFAVLGVTLGILCKTKSKKLKELALPAAVSALFGVTEPATYAIVMPRMKYLVVTCVSSAIACGVGGLFGFAVYTIPGFGIFKIPGYIDPANPVQSLIVASGVMLLATALGFIITYVMFNDAQYGDDKE